MPWEKEYGPYPKVVTINVRKTVAYVMTVVCFLYMAWGIGYLLCLWIGYLLCEEGT